jgi:hypothetical protein
MRPIGWTADELAAGGGIAVALAGTAEAAWSLHARFAVDFSGLSALERAGAALWDFRPLGTALFLVGAIFILSALRRSSGPLAPAGEPVAGGVAVLAAAHAALAVAVLAASGWVAAAGRLGEPDELGFAFSPGERAVTLATQIAAWLPLGVVLGLVAVLAARLDMRDAVAPGLDRVAAGTDPEPHRSLGDEMEEFWRERLAFGPGRERGRVLLGRIRALEAAGDDEAARKLADEMRRL